MRVDRLGKKASVTVLGGVVCSLLAVSPSDGAWSAPEKIASSRVWEYSRPLVATDSAGGGVLVWYREEKLNETLGGIEASTHTTGSWSAPVVLASGQPGAVFDRQLAMSARGRATAVWQNIKKIQVASGRLPRGFACARTLSGPVVQGAAKPTVALTRVAMRRSSTHGLRLACGLCSSRFRALARPAAARGDLAL